MADWRALLAEAAARSTVAATARRLGYSRTSVSLALAGKYPGGTDKLALAVLAVLGTVDCPHLERPVTPAECVDNSGEVPTSSPTALRLWRACRSCPHNPANKQPKGERDDPA